MYINADWLRVEAARTSHGCTYIAHVHYGCYSDVNYSRKREFPGTRTWITGLRNEALLLLRVSSLRTHPSPPLCLVFTFFSGAFAPGSPWLTYKCGGGC